MFDGLLVEQIRGDEEIAGMLARYMGQPAFFFQKAPPDVDDGWEKPTFPRVNYSIDMRYDPERKVGGVLTVVIHCTAESRYMPEDIERRFNELISGTFYTNRAGETACAIWNRSEGFLGAQKDRRRSRSGDTSPEVFGIVMSFDLLQFPKQITTDPDPILGLNLWTRRHFPEMAVIAHEQMPGAVWKPTDENPAIYWRFEGSSLGQASYAVNWYTGQFAGHIIAVSVTERNRWIKATVERLQLDGEVVLTDESPMLARQIAIRHSADPLREGQLLLTGQYGVLAQHRRETAQMPLNHPHFNRR